MDAVSKRIPFHFLHLRGGFFLSAAFLTASANVMPAILNSSGAGPSSLGGRLPGIFLGGLLGHWDITGSTNS